eukprot:gene6551-10557_t
MNDKEKQAAIKRAKKEKDAADFELLKKVSEQNTVTLTLERQLFYLVLALLTSCLPNYLFQSILDMPMNNFNLGIYIVVTIVSTVLLSTGYHNYFMRTRGKLSEKYDKIVSQSQKFKLQQHQKSHLKSEQQRLTDLGSAGYGIMFGNLVYLLTVLSFTFYFLKNVDVRANYVISCLVGAALSSFLSTSRKKKNQE